MDDIATRRRQRFREVFPEGLFYHATAPLESLSSFTGGLDGPERDFVDDLVYEMTTPKPPTRRGRSLVFCGHRATLKHLGGEFYTLAVRRVPRNS